MATKFVLGGVYMKLHYNGTRVYGVLTCSTQRANGFAEGLIVTNGWPPERVVEGTRELDAWSLISEPTPSDVVRNVEQFMLKFAELQGQVEDLEAKVSSLEHRLQAEKTTPAPLDPASAVAAARRRATV